MLATKANETAQAYQLASQNLTAFKQLLYRQYQHPAHLDMLDRALMQCTRYIETQGEEGISRLIVEMPPRHGKTLTVSRFYPAWHLGRNPNTRVMPVSYGASLAYTNSRAARNIIKSPYYKGIFPHVELSTDSASQQSWNFAPPYEGGCDAVGIDGSATGKGAHVLICDDLVKNRAEAESALMRDKIWEAFLSDLYNRLEPNGVIILMHTRWHIDDPVGRALEMRNEGWLRLRLPALAEENDILGRKQGEALWPERFGKATLENIQEVSGEYNFASLYQQRPMPSKAGLFDVSKMNIIEVVSEPIIDSMRFYDLAVTAKKHSDYTAGVRLGIDKQENVYVLHVYRMQKTPVQVESDIVSNALLDGRSTKIRLEAEKAGIVQLDYLLRNPALRGYALDATPPVGDKYTRAQPIAARVNAGKVYMLKAEWNRAFMDELAVFPMGAHDDQVDALSGAYDGLVNSSFEVEIHRYA